MTYAGRRVLVTGHTGFKGGWLTLWLDTLGAEVHGYALDPPTTPNLFDAARIRDVLGSDTRGDLADLPALTATLQRVRPELVFHLAAQPLVREGYRDPLGTVRTNVLGTTHLLEAVRATDSVRGVVVVATDKVYANAEAGVPFTEDDALGGHDPYSASKAAAEIVVASYRASFFGRGGHPARIATARAGNVIGGGDWAPERLVPDCVRAFEAGEPVRLRHPDAVRPWQHVMEPLAGYLEVGSRLLGANGEAFARPWNFGPDRTDDATVGDVARRIAELWDRGATVEEGSDPGWNEAGVLRLDSADARDRLGWRPRWRLDEALRRTVDWYVAARRGLDMRAVTLEQVAAHASVAVL